MLFSWNQVLLWYVNVCILFVLLCVNAALCEHTGKELPGSVMLITRSTQVTPWHHTAVICKTPRDIISHMTWYQQILDSSWRNIWDFDINRQHFKLFQNKNYINQVVWNKVSLFFLSALRGVSKPVTFSFKNLTPHGEQRYITFYNGAF